MNIKKPLISVIIPLFNKENSVERAIDSVLGQTVSEIEVVVINDGSTDDSLNVVSRFLDSRIVLIEQINAGVAAARNSGIEKATSDLIAFLDADDEWEPDYIESILSLAAQYPQCAVYATSYILRDGNDTALPHISFPAVRGIIYDYFLMARKGSPPLWTSAVTVRKKAILSIGAFTKGVRTGEDLLCWAKLAQNYSIAFLDQPKAVYNFPLNLGADSDVRMPDTHDRVYQGLVDLYRSEPAGERKKSINRYIGHWCKIRMHLFIYMGKKTETLAEYQKLLRHDPLNVKAFVLAILVIAPAFLRRYIFKKRARSMV